MSPSGVLLSAASMFQILKNWQPAWTYSILYCNN